MLEILRESIHLCHLVEIASLSAAAVEINNERHMLSITGGNIQKEQQHGLVFLVGQLEAAARGREEKGASIEGDISK